MVSCREACAYAHRHQNILSNSFPIVRIVVVLLGGTLILARIDEASYAFRRCDDCGDIDTAVINTLYASSEDKGEEGFDKVYGHGRLDLGSAVTRTLIRRNGLQFAVGLAMALALAGLGRIRTRKAGPMVLASAVTAGGLFLLPLLPLPPNAAVDLLSRDLLTWPAVLIGPDWVHFPLWASALLPCLLAFVLGPSRALGPWVAGLCIGFGTSLLYGAASGSIDPWALSLGLDKLWLSANGTACILAAMAVVGLQKLNEEPA